MSYSWLPPTLAEIAEVAGLDAALAMADVRGGSRISIPSDPPEGHWLVNAVGMDLAQEICSHFSTGYGGKGGAVFDLPLSPNLDLVKRRKRIDQLIADGVSADKIAVETRTHRTTVFRRQAKLRAGEDLPKHPDLFD